MTGPDTSEVIDHEHAHGLDDGGILVATAWLSQRMPAVALDANGVQVCTPVEVQTITMRSEGSGP